MGLKKWLKRAKKKFITKPLNKLNPFKMKLPGDGSSPAASALVKRMKRRQSGEGFAQANVEEYK